MSTDWIKIFIEDRLSMAKIMRQNAAADLLAGYSMRQIAEQMLNIEKYESETDRLLNEFQRNETKGQILAYNHLKKIGAIA